jgi:hypothetical protein
MSFVPTQLDLAIVVMGSFLTVITIGRIARTNLDRLPLSALVLLFLFYSALGWFLAIYNVPWWVWLGGFVASVAIANVPSIDLGRTGLAAFGFAVIAAIVAIFTKANAGIARAVALVLALVGAWLWTVGGTRYRMEKVRMPRSTIRWTIILISWEGIWVGWVIDTFLTARFGQWLSQNLLLF